MTWRFPSEVPAPPASGIQSANDGFEFIQSANAGNATLDTAN